MVNFFKETEEYIIEYKELDYLNRIKYILETELDKMLFGFSTKEQIREDWKKHLKDNSDFDVGAERIFYWIFNQFGTPNSSPIGADLFFETHDAYVHIDIKTVTTKNSGDYKNIFLSQNQTSYSSNFETTTGRAENFIANLPNYYTKQEKDGNQNRKICLTYLITILYNSDGTSILHVGLICIPNGKLTSVYENNVFKAGKNPGSGKVRFNSKSCKEFLELSKKSKNKYFRMITIYKDDSLLIQNKVESVIGNFK